MPPEEVNIFSNYTHTMHCAYNNAVDYQHLLIKFKMLARIQNPFVSSRTSYRGGWEGKHFYDNMDFVVTLSKSIQTVRALKIIRFLYLLFLSNR